MTSKKTPDIKICGICELETIEAISSMEIHYLGFVFYPPSPRHLEIKQAKELFSAVPDHMEKIGLFVDPSNETLDDALTALELDLIQLHGNEQPERVLEITETYHLPIIKALRVGSQDDVSQSILFEDICDFILFDSKIEGLQGGSGKSFNWELLDKLKLSTSWGLSGGLDENNVKRALSKLTPDIVDISSGVESAPGKKDITKIKAFVDAVNRTGY
jgi:phosphoribosylanthranilate isomerase